VVHEAIGIRHGQITTIHNPTNTNVVGRRSCYP
jgi:glyceraldehyde 3-phosphate dehydrogenase